MKFAQSTGAALMCAAVLSTSATAQQMINGAEVPPDQIERVQAHCDALLADGGPGGPGGGETTPPEPANDIVTNPAQAAAVGNTTTAQGNGADEQVAIDWETDDIAEVIDFDMCVEGGFIDPAAAAGMGEAGQNAGGQSTTPN